MVRGDQYWPLQGTVEEGNLLKPVEPRFNARYVNSLQEVQKKIRYGNTRPDSLIVANAGLKSANGTYLRSDASDFRDVWIKEDNKDYKIYWSIGIQAWLMEYTSLESGDRVAPYRLQRDFRGEWIVNDDSDFPGELPNPIVKFQAHVDPIHGAKPSTDEDFPVTGEQPSRPQSPLRSQVLMPLLQPSMPLLPPRATGLSTVAEGTESIGGTAPVGTPPVDVGADEQTNLREPAQLSNWFGNVGTKFKELML